MFVLNVFTQILQLPKMYVKRKNPWVNTGNHHQIENFETTNHKFSRFDKSVVKSNSIIALAPGSIDFVAYSTQYIKNCDINNKSMWKNNLGVGINYIRTGAI